MATLALHVQLLQTVVAQAIPSVQELGSTDPVGNALHVAAACLLLMALILMWRAIRPLIAIFIVLAEVGLATLTLAAAVIFVLMTAL